MGATERCPDCDLPPATDRDHTDAGCRRCADNDATCPHAGLCWAPFGGRCNVVDWRERFLAIRRSVRALSNLDNDALDAVTPAAMQRVMERREWEREADVAWSVDPSVTNAVRYRRGAWVAYAPARRGPCFGREVKQWAQYTAEAHGDTTAAEVLAEALTESRS